MPIIFWSFYIYTVMTSIVILKVEISINCRILSWGIFHVEGYRCQCNFLYYSHNYNLPWNEHIHALIHTFSPVINDISLWWNCWASSLSWLVSKIYGNYNQDHSQQRESKIDRNGIDAPNNANTNHYSPKGQWCLRHFQIPESRYPH